MTSTDRPEPAAIGIGVELRRSYVAADVASGSARTVARALGAYVGREDVVRLWLTREGEKLPFWRHRGPLDEVPDIDALLATDEVANAA